MKFKKFLTAKNLKLVFLVVLSSSLLFAFYLLIFRSDFFVIRKVDCKISGSVSEADQKRWCQAARRWLRGKKIFFYDREEVAAGVKQLFFPVGEISFKNHYPNRVELEISERVPVVKVSKPGGRFFLVDRKGVVFSEDQREGLRGVILVTDEEISLGSRLDETLVSIFVLEDPPVKLVESIENGFRAETDAGLVVFFSDQKQLSGQIRTLQAILKKYNLEGKVLKKVDLRFERPVVSY